MADYFYNPEVFDTTTDVKTLQDRIEKNFDALVKNFAGPSKPNEEYNGELWYNTGANELQINRNGTWIPVFNVATGSPSIAPNSITSDMISNSARKGSIVSGENISPASCTLRATSFIASMPSRPYTETQSYFTVGSGIIFGNFIYVPEGTSRLYAFIQAKVGEISSATDLTLKLGSTIGSTAEVRNQTYSPYIMNVEVGSKTGWQQFQMDYNVRLGSFYYQGYSTSSNEPA